LQPWISSTIDQVNAMPDWLRIGTAVIVAATTALLLHRLVYHMLERWLRATERIAWLMILRKTKGPTGLAVVLFFVISTLRLMPIGGLIAEVLIRTAQLSLIALLTWVTIVTTDIFGLVYLRRFRQGSQDDLTARKQLTQVRILKRAAMTVIAVIGIGAMLMSFDAFRQYGVSLFASAGVAGLAIGLAARPLLSNLIAGIQIAITQPIRIQDVVVVEGEYGTVEEITSTYVVVQLWDWRRMVLPLSYFIEKPFENWSRESSSLIGAVTFSVDYSVDVDAIRAKLEQLVAGNARWDKQVVNLQVTDAAQDTIQLRALVSAPNASASWDLRCDIREQLIAFVRSEMPDSLPRVRQQILPQVSPGENQLAPVPA
jgi:small-conductance mechanosensitive channel